MTDPYRERVGATRIGILDSERRLLVGSGRAMMFVGALGVIIAVAAFVLLPGERRVTLAVPVGLVAGFAGLIFQAGWVLWRLPGDGRDYAAVERSIRSLSLLYATKSVLVVAVIAACVFFRYVARID